MCVIIIKQKGKQVPLEVARTSARLNPDGLGVMWLDTFQVTYHKSSNYKVLNTTRPYIAHFRYATVGAVGIENTHPFKCGKNTEEWLMMNGTIKGLGDAKTCDSKVLANAIGNMPRDKWKSELQKYICRFVTINAKTKTYEIYNKELWTQKDGVWYSKDNVLEDNVIAVYGTLKKGFNNYYNYLSSSKHLGSGKTKDKYPLIIQGLPYLIDKKGVGHNVEVDVFKVSDAVLDSLDRLEGHPNWYRRKQIEVNVKGRTICCWVYFNPTENHEGKQLHKSYTQQVRNYFSFEPTKYNIPAVKEYKRKYYYEDIIDDFVEEEDEFNRKNEKPMCVNCFHDLEHDMFSNYHCNSCDGWFNESEIIK
jgi:gamma-glutamylaminecyclotransferase